MRITVNGSPREVADGITIQAMLEQLELQRTRVAVAVNKDVVPRAQHAEHRLAEGDRVEIVQAVQGG